MGVFTKKKKHDPVACQVYFDCVMGGIEGKTDLQLTNQLNVILEFSESVASLPDGENIEVMDEMGRTCLIKNSKGKIKILNTSIY